MLYSAFSLHCEKVYIFNFYSFYKYIFLYFCIFQAKPFKIFQIMVYIGLAHSSHVSKFQVCPYTPTVGSQFRLPMKNYTFAKTTSWQHLTRIDVQIALAVGGAKILPDVENLKHLSTLAPHKNRFKNFPFLFQITLQLFTFNSKTRSIVVILIYFNHITGHIVVTSTLLTHKFVLYFIDWILKVLLLTYPGTMCFFFLLRTNWWITTLHLIIFVTLKSM